MTEDRYKAFTMELFQNWQQRECCDIDGGDLQALFERHGFGHDDVATEADCAEDWAIDVDLQPGALMIRWDSELFQKSDVGSQKSERFKS